MASKPVTDDFFRQHVAKLIQYGTVCKNGANLHKSAGNPIQEDKWSQVRS
jgi:hypothetical protein